jgi:hypothetical protein
MPRTAGGTQERTYGKMIAYHPEQTFLKIACTVVTDIHTLKPYLSIE